MRIRMRQYNIDVAERVPNTCMLCTQQYVEPEIVPDFRHERACRNAGCLHPAWYED